jgi:hypothetical protein
MIWSLLNNFSVAGVVIPALMLKVAEDLPAALLAGDFGTPAALLL